MDAIITRIKNYVHVIDSTLPVDDFLTFIVQNVTDRALVYMSRDQFIEQYEADLVDTNVSPTDYVVPIPQKLETSLAMAVIGVYKNTKNLNTTTHFAVKSAEDNGQRVMFNDNLLNFLYTKSDQEIFSGIMKLLDNYKVPTIVQNENRRHLWYDDSRYILR